MTLLDELRASEERLSTSDLEYYRRVCRPDAMFVMPGMVATLDEAVAGLEQASAWDHVELTNVQVRELGEDAAAIIYRFHGARGEQSYVADMISTYSRSDDAWRLVTHQQTPA